MNPLIPLKKAIPLFLVALLLACFAIVCVVQAQSLTPSESPIASPSPTEKAALPSPAKSPTASPFGRSRVSYGREECVALPPAPGTEIDSGRKDDEDDLCKIKFDDPNVILCPALYSTNPGTDIYELPTGVSRASFEQKECAKATGRNAHFLAKYKQSTSCSYTPAILAYGKVADALKIHVDVPSVVYRTMEQATHKGVEKMAGVYAHDLIKQTWAGLVSQMANSNPKVIKDGLLYGALLDHQGGIDHHPTLNHRGPDPNPAAPFLASSTWAMATKGSEIRSQIPPSLKTLGQMMAVRDVGEMAIIDHILAQQDRFGNVAKKEKIFWLEQTAAGQKLHSVKATKANKPIDGTNQTTMQYLNANHIPYVQFPVMVLADNDCGLRQNSNVVQKNNMVQHLRHISSSVYKHVQSFAKTNPGDLLEYFQNQTLMTSDEAKGVIARLQEVASILKKNCDNGTLLFDSDPEIFLGIEQIPPKNCE